MSLIAGAGAASGSCVESEVYSSQGISRFTRHLIGDPTWRDGIAKIIAIYKCNLDKKDEDSILVSHWCGEVCGLIYSASDSDEFLDRFALKLHEFRGIAKDRVDGKPFDHVIRANGRLYEGWKLKIIRDLFENRSPYDDGELDSGEEFIYMNEVIRWIDRFLMDSTDIKINKIALRLLELRKMEVRRGWLEQSVVEEEARSWPDETRKEFQNLYDQLLEHESWSRLTSCVSKAEECFDRTLETAKTQTEKHIQELVSELDHMGSESSRNLKELEALYQNLLASERAFSLRISKVMRSLEALQDQINCERARNDANARAAADCGGGGCSIM